MNDCNTLQGTSTTEGIIGGVIGAGGAVLPLAIAGGPAMFLGMVIMTMGTQIMNSSISRKQRVDAEIEKQKMMCEQTKLMNTQVEQLESLLKTLSDASTIQKNTEDRISHIGNTFLAQKEILKDKKNEYKKHLSVYAIMNIMILMYLYIILYYK